MRFMILIKADAATEAGTLPSEQLLTDMGRFNEDLLKAGVLQAGEGLHPSARGARVTFDGEQRHVEHGPFDASTGGLIAGFWIWQCTSLQEAIGWAQRCPKPTLGASQIEIRRIYEAADFGAEFTPELRAQEEARRASVRLPGGSDAQR